MNQFEGCDFQYRPCVGIMLFNSAGNVFVGRRIDSTQEAWQMPQGGIDDGEDPIQSALRELEEETGIGPELVEYVAEIEDWLRYDLPKKLVPRLWGGKYKGQRQKWFLYRYLGTDDEINISTAVPEFSSWCWFPMDRLVNHIVPFKRHVYRRVIEEFEAYFQPNSARQR